MDEPLFGNILTDSLDAGYIDDTFDDANPTEPRVWLSRHRPKVRSFKTNHPKIPLGLRTAPPKTYTTSLPEVLSRLLAAKRETYSCLAQS